MMSAHARAGFAAFGAAIVMGGGWIAASDRSRQAAEEAGRISVIEFSALHASGGVLAIDVRPSAPFAAGHIPGAINVPLIEIADRAAEIMRRAGGRRIVTYCACPSESSSAAAARELTRRGLRGVSALAGGLDEWLLKGGRVEKAVKLAAAAR
jgi:rhodanese-related sulfurtransferase